MKRKGIILGLTLAIVLVAATSWSFLFKKKIDPVYLTAQELLEFNGKDGKPVYVAIEGEIYDLTKCRYWKKGVHSSSPVNGIAGQDLTELLKESTHGIARVKRYPLVGYVVDNHDDDQKNTE